MNDQIAERQVLAIALGSGDASMLTEVSDDVWTDEKHALVASVLTERSVRGIPIEPQGVAKAVMARAGSDRVAKQHADLVLALFALAPPAAALPYYLERIVGLATARKVAKSASRLAQYLETFDGVDDDRFAHEVSRMREVCESTVLTASTVEPPMDLRGLLDGTEAHDWLIPGLLERMDRVMLVAPEGTGKSRLLCQFAATTAAGLHPFTGEPLPYRQGGYRVLVVDCENSRRQLRRTFRGLAAQVDRLVERAGLDAPDWPENLRFVIRPEGVSLTDPRELGRLEQSVTAAAPDLMVIGPLYRLSKVDVRDEQAAKELTDCIDQIRVRHGVTVMCETHAGHGQNGAGARSLRPLGSSLFLRWPEFGLAMRPHETCQDQEHPSLMNIVSWRGSRDERDWPRQLEHGQWLPWVPTVSLRSVS